MEYQTNKGSKPAKFPQNFNCLKCKFKCSEIFSEDLRRDLCESYWQLETFSRKKDFILKNVKLLPVQRQRLRKEGGKLRTNSKQFYFSKNGTNVRVCMSFFMKTLNISNGPINKAFENKNDNSGLYQGDDKRGKHPPANKLPELEKQLIKQHIESFPLTESHYCRKSSGRKYLDATLSISKMYSLYGEICIQNNRSCCSLTTYKRIFSLEYNYAFFKPRKDQCSICNRYQMATPDKKIELKSSYDDHKQREMDANNSKKDDKERATNEVQFKTVTFDLQSVLQIPSSEVSPLYYSRKLSAYNLTIYEGAPPNNAYCFTWTEINGARGSLEIGTCLYRYFKKLPEHVTEVSLFSDTCGGQNRNQNVLALLYYFVHYEATNLEVIEQKFLESGHSMMECDSMHSAIEKQKRNLSVYTMNDWINIFKMARSKRGKKRNEAYEVNELKFTDFIDLRRLSSDLLNNKSVNTEGERVNWLKIKCFKIEKVSPNLVKYRYSHSGNYLTINIRKRGRPAKTPTLVNAYSAMLPISVAKNKDLKKLCSTNVIPPEFHGWYMSLPTSETVRDKNPEPTLDSESGED